MDVRSVTGGQQNLQELLERLGIVGVEERVVHSRLRWFGHVERKSDDDFVSTYREMSVVGARRI